jgi:prepilin signal peptidase PulO-like enzyme (type II secretory pathway)
MKDKKFVILMALLALWVVLFIGTAAGEIKAPNVERLVSVILLVWGIYWTFSALGWVKKSDSTEEKSAPEKSADTCSCGDSHKETKPNAPKTKNSAKS